MVKAFIIVSKSKTEFIAPNKLSKPIVPNSAWLNSSFLCSISIGLWSEVIISITPSFTPLSSAFVSFFVRNGGVTLTLLSNESNSLSVKIK